jgi:hypothetical protein
MPSKWGGMGFRRMSDTVNSQKMAHLYRKTNHSGMTKNSLLALIELVCREKGIETKSKPWEIAINREGSNDEEKHYLRNLNGMNPEQWKVIKSGGMALNTIIEQLKRNHKLNQGRIRNERIIMGKKWRKKLENEADEGRPGGMNVNIMGKKKVKYMVKWTI